MRVGGAATARVAKTQPSGTSPRDPDATSATTEILSLNSPQKRYWCNETSGCGLSLANETENEQTARSASNSMLGDPG